MYEGSQSPLSVKSEAFAGRVVKMVQHLHEKGNKHLASVYNQILRSGTSISANIGESQFAQSPADFITKLHIALKETAETEYWLHLLQKSDYLDDNLSASLLNDCLEIKRILIASINTTKSICNNILYYMI